MENWVTATAGCLQSREVCFNHGSHQYMGLINTAVGIISEERTLSVHAVDTFHSNYCIAIMVELWI